MVQKMSMKKRSIIFVLAVIVIGIAIIGALSGYFIDYQWFRELGYTEVFFKKFFTQMSFFLPSFFILATVFYIYLRSINLYAVKNSRLFLTVEQSKWRNKVFIVIAAVLSIIFSISFVSELWYDFLIFMNKSSFNISDPIFGYDIGFFVFSLPFLNKLYSFISRILVVFAVITVVFNVFLFISPRGRKEDDERETFAGALNKDTYKEIFRSGGKQLSIIAGLFFILIGLGFYLRSFGLLYSARGIAFGAGYTDIKVSLPFYYFYMVLCVIIAISFVFSYKIEKYKTIVFAPLALIIAVFASGIITSAVQSLIVTPNELSKEEKYLQHNIDYTNYAYGLDKVSVNQFEAAQDLNREDIDRNDIIINNIPVNDYKPAKDIYNQIQGLKSYYQFYDMDIDRYTIDGEYRQVFISARELESANIPHQEGGRGTSWINRYLKYTHGYGVTMSPVNEVTSSGQPRLFIKDLPVISEVDIKLDRPQIYFGEITKDFVIVNTREKEFDYPSSSGNVETVYEGTGGIRLTFLNRIMLALTQGKMNFILSQDINSQSRILLNREVISRARKLAPFLYYDEDPYIVVSDGKLFWIIDAYTVSNKYPYSKPMNDNSDINYIRNSVKVIVDAYNGTTDFYIADESDPIVNTYSNVFKTMFKPLDEMDDDLRAHIRYPQTIFDIQTEIYSRYHIRDAREFYNKSDVWEIATQIYGASGAMDSTELVESSYLIMKLPDSDEEEFILMVPYTPQGKNNMVSWFAVKNDGENYGQLKLYTFPSGKIVEGPMQVEGIISQDVAIGNAINLLQSGGNSEVVRGNMLIIPIEDSILYVEPIYLRASNASALPELKKVIVFYRNKVVMEDSLKEALEKVFPAIDREEEEEIQIQTPKDQLDDKEITDQPRDGIEDLNQLIIRANKVFEEAENAQKQGNWALYGEKIEELQRILKRLEGQM